MINTDRSIDLRQGSEFMESMKAFPRQDTSEVGGLAVNITCSHQMSSSGEVELEGWLSTCIESSKLALTFRPNCYDFFVCDEALVLSHLSTPASTAAFRPKTPGQQVCPAIILPTSKQALIPIGKSHEICWCQTHN